jgi:glucose-6-phosphate 1-dehydrogenase
MDTIKFFILGISGNLAKEKVLPAIGQFHGLYGNQINIEIHGYSRSEVDLVDIQKMTCLANSSSCPRINLYNGEYENNQVYHDLVSGLQSNERLIVYLAIPPSIFIKFLQNSCPYGKHRLDILMEKPFGASEIEANQIIRIIDACDLSDSVHFIDHYWFKNPSRINFDLISKELELDITKLNKIKIQALEKIDIGSRKGYYDHIGATKDMLVHLYSLLNLSKSLFIDNQFEVEINKVIDLNLGQYKTYQGEIDDFSSSTETYFDIKTEFKYKEKNIEVEFESGKKQLEKKTKIILEFENKIVEYNLAPHSNIIMFENGKEDKVINIEDSKALDHTNVFLDVWHNEFNRFVPEVEVVKGWKVFNKVQEFKDANNIKVKKY